MNVDNITVADEMYGKHPIHVNLLGFIKEHKTETIVHKKALVNCARHFVHLTSEHEFYLNGH